MSKPNFENIDRWFFEYSEGNLSAPQETELMNFLNLHPELKSELQAWESAKVKVPAHEELATDHLIKPVPFLLRPMALVSIALLTFGAGWLGVQLYPSAPLYSKSTIDAEIIDAETEKPDDFINQMLVMNKSIKEKEELEKEHTSTFPSNNKVKKASQTSNNSVSTNRKIKDLIDQDKSVVAQKSKENISSNNTTKVSTEINKTEDNMAIIKTSSKQIEADDLAIIENYLVDKNKSDNIFNSASKGEVTARKDRKSHTYSYASKSSLSKTISSAFRKVKRMAEYPVALRNTKNPHFHVPMMTGYNANFAMVGTAPGNRIQATSRMQWYNQTNSQLMNSLSYDGYIYAIRGGLGIDVNYNNYQNNGLNNYSASITYSPKFSINKDISFEPALRFKMGTINLDQNADIIGEPIEVNRKNIIPLFTEQQEVNGRQLWYRDIGLGFMLNTKSFYLGFTADNLGQHRNNYYSSDLSKDYKSDVHYTAVIGTEYASKTRDIRLSGYGLYQNYGNLNEFWLGSNFQYKWMQIGVAASSNGDVAGSLGAVFKQLSIHYNADFTESRLLNNQVLSHQLTMKILLKPSRYAAKFLKI